MEDGLLIELTMNHVMSTVAMINHESIDSLPMLFAVLVAREDEENEGFAQSYLYGLEVDESQVPQYQWAEIRGRAGEIPLDTEVVRYPAKSLNDMAEQIAQRMIDTQELVVATFAVANGSVEIVHLDDDAPTPLEIPAASDHSAFITGCDAGGKQAVAFVPLARDETHCLRVKGPIHITISRGNFPLFRVFWAAYTNDEKSTARFN